MVFLPLALAAPSYKEGQLLLYNRKLPNICKEKWRMKDLQMEVWLTSMRQASGDFTRAKDLVEEAAAMEDMTDCQQLDPMLKEEWDEFCKLNKTYEERREGGYDLYWKLGPPISLKNRLGLKMFSEKDAKMSDISHVSWERILSMMTYDGCEPYDVILRDKLLVVYTEYQEAATCMGHMEAILREEDRLQSISDRKESRKLQGVDLRCFDDGAWAIV